MYNKRDVISSLIILFYLTEICSTFRSWYFIFMIALRFLIPHGTFDGKNVHLSKVFAHYFQIYLREQLNI